MKNVKRLIAGILAAAVMMSSVPGGTAYAAEAVEEETAVNENEDVKDVEENDNSDPTESDDNTDSDNETVINEDVKDDSETVVSEDVSDDETVISEDGDDEEEIVTSEDISNEETTEQVSDEDVMETEEAEFNADLSVSSSFDYDSFEEYVVKQLKAKYVPGQTSEIIVDVSSYKIQYNDILDTLNVLGGNLSRFRDGELYFLKRLSKYDGQQNILTKLYFSIDTEIDDAAFQKGIKAALATVNDNMSDFQKMVVLHDYLVINCSYDTTTEYCKTVYGALAEGPILCEGYAKAYRYLLNLVGIECHLVSNDGHMWNLVKLDGEWYHVDVTYDDNPAMKYYWQFLSSDSLISRNHQSPWRIMKSWGVTLDIKATSTLYDNAPWRTQIGFMVFDNETYTITYILNGGTNSSENPATYTKGTEVRFKDPSRTGYQFDGWYLDSDFKTKIAALSANSTGNKTLYAKWSKAETYTITYVLNGGINNSENPATYTKGVGVTFKDPSRTGYRFDGWYINPDLVHGRVTCFGPDVYGNATIYAKWVEIETPSETETETEIETETPSETETETSEIPSEIETETETQTETSETPSETYTITYVLNGGINNSENPATYTKGTEVWFKDPSRTGYQFDGWYMDAKFTANQRVKALSIYSTGDKTIYAKWSELEKPDTPDTLDSEQTDLHSVGAQITAIKAKVYDGEAYEPVVKVTAIEGGKRTTLTEGMDYCVFYEDNVDAGTGKVTVKGDGIYKGEISATFMIHKKPVKKLKILTGSITGSVTVSDLSTLPVYVYDGAKRLSYGTDYTLSGYAAVNVNTAQVTVMGTQTSNYEGITTVKFPVCEGGTQLDVTLVPEKAGVEGYAYTGKAVKPAVTVKANGSALGIADYKVSYQNNINAGTAYVIVTGKDAYKGKTVVVPFRIHAETIASPNDFIIKDIKAKTYNGKLQKPSVSVSILKNGKIKKLSKKDYTVAYKNNLHAAKTGEEPATIIVTGKGNYAGLRAEKTFTINSQQIKKASLKGTQGSLTLTYNKRKLKEGTDYELQYGAVTKNKIEVLITGKGDFTGTVIKKVNVR